MLGLERHTLTMLFAALVAAACAGGAPSSAIFLLRCAGAVEPPAAAIGQAATADEPEAAPANAQPGGNRADAQQAGKEEDALPPPLQFYKGREIAPYMTYAGADWLIRKERQQEEDCSRLLKALRLKPGQTVCDMGCGNGFYTLRMARIVGEKGKVLAVDIQPEMLSLLDKQLKGKHITNVEPVLGRPNNPCLPEGKVDLILMVDVYHEFSYPDDMLRAMRQSLAPGGRVALAEYRLEDPTVPIKLLHKMSKEQILKEYEPNGLKLVDAFDGLPWQHLMFFGRDDDAHEDNSGAAAAHDGAANGTAKSE